MIESLIFGLVILTITSLWVLIEQRKNPKFLIWFIPLLLVLVSSTYVTYTSILGYAKISMPKEGMYLQHHVAEPNWIYLWVLEKRNTPRAYKIPYSKEKHNALEGVKKKSEEGSFMVLGDNDDMLTGDEGEIENSRRGFTLGGDIGFYEWDYETSLTPKDTQ